MTDESGGFRQLGLLRLQSWLSPGFPIGSYSYSHGLEWAVEARHVHDRETLVDWLDADLQHGSGRNEAIFFSEAWRCASSSDRVRFSEIAELSAVLRGTAELALEASQQASACLATLSKAWPDGVPVWLSDLPRRGIQPALSVLLGACAAVQGVPARLALPAFLQASVANWVTAGVRLIPLGQTDGQLAIAALEEAVLHVSARAQEATIGDLGSAALMVDFAAMAHETQYTRLFRS